MSFILKQISNRFTSTKEWALEIRLVLVAPESRDIQKLEPRELSEKMNSSSRGNIKLPQENSQRQQSVISSEMEVDNKLLPYKNLEENLVSSLPHLLRLKTKQEGKIGGFKNPPKQFERGQEGRRSPATK